MLKEGGGRIVFAPVNRKQDTQVPWVDPPYMRQPQDLLECLRGTLRGRKKGQ